MTRCPVDHLNSDGRYKDLLYVDGAISTAHRLSAMQGIRCSATVLKSSPPRQLPASARLRPAGWRRMRI